jgi:hypothetical protein
VGGGAEGEENADEAERGIDDRGDDEHPVAYVSPDGRHRAGILANLTAVPICVVWVYAALTMAERRAGYVILMLGSLLGLVVPVIHIMGRVGCGGGNSFAKTRGGSRSTV